jgi:hypothetical protein
MITSSLSSLFFFRLYLPSLTCSVHVHHLYKVTFGCIFLQPMYICRMIFPIFLNVAANCSALHNALQNESYLIMLYWARECHNNVTQSPLACSRFFTEARCPKAGCPRTHGQKPEMTYGERGIFLRLQVHMSIERIPAWNRPEYDISGPVQTQPNTI